MKDAPAGEVLAAARELAAGRSPDHLLIVNDRPDIALLAGADGVHLGQTDVPIRDARQLLGTERLIGATCRSLADVERSFRVFCEVC